MSASEGGDTDVSDPVASSFYKEVWMKQASLNTVVFEKVFKCVPTDTVRSFNELKVRRGIISVISSFKRTLLLFFRVQAFQSEDTMAQSHPVEALEMLRAKVRGHLVILPLRFLCREPSLAPTGAKKEALAPTIIWT